jgi:hypothetical protein
MILRANLWRVLLFAQVTNGMQSVTARYFACIAFHVSSSEVVIRDQWSVYFFCAAVAAILRQ